MQEAELRGASDDEHLAFALRERRTIVTQDADFLRLHAVGRSHWGIVYASQRASIGAVIQGLLLIREALEPDDMFEHVEFL